MDSNQWNLIRVRRVSSALLSTSQAILQMWILANNQKIHLKGHNFTSLNTITSIEEVVGFEPTDRYSRSSVFKTDAIDHSAILPKGTNL